MKEVTHRTDLLSAARICFKYAMTDREFAKLRTDGFPEPEYSRVLPLTRNRVRTTDKPRRVLLWTPSAVEAFMEKR